LNCKETCHIERRLHILINYYPKHGKVEVCGHWYDYTIDKLSDAEYRCYVPACKEACVTKPYEIEEHHVKTYIYQAEYLRFGPDESD